MDSFLEGAVTLRLIGRIACMMGGRGSDRPRTLIFRVTEMAWQIRYPEKVLGRRNPVKCAQNNVTLLFFPDFSPATRDQEKGIWSGFEERWQHLVSSPSSSIQRWLSYGTKENREASIPLRKRRIYQFHVSAEVLCRRSSGGTTGSSGRCFSGSTGGAWRPGWTWP